MNRKKKIKQILIKRMKQAQAKSAPKSNKPRYISKAEREKMAIAGESEGTQEIINE